MPSVSSLCIGPLLSLAVMMPCVVAGANPVLPPRPASVDGVANPLLSLDGDWQFRATVGADAKRIRVPGEWAMQGFTVPAGQWAEYHRSFELPSDWAGKSIGVRFDGVHAVCAVEVNGRSVGYHEGGFVPFEIDVSGAVRAGQANEIVVRVQCESFADTLSCITQYAAHPVGGIVRGVSVVCRPTTHAQSLTHVVVVDGETVTLAVHTDVTGPCEVTQTLTDPQAGIVATGSGNDVSLRVEKASLWTSETPHLYELRTTIAVEGRPVEMLTQRIGLRQIRVDGNRLLVNGSPVKLLGVNRHEIHPLTGRSITAELCRRDVEMFRAANVNVIRTSHYPPSEAFLDACDELGMFVECEAAVCWIGHSASPIWKSWDNKDEKFLPAFLQASEEMVAAYRNHASIFAWSPANESPWTPLFAKVIDRIRATDPTRPVIFHDQNWEPSKRNNADVVNFHYPNPPGKDDWPVQDRPFWFGEYAHVECYNRRELATDPFVRDDWARQVSGMVDAIWARPGVLGGCIWAGIDDVFHLPDGNLCGYGHWGVIDAWRRTKPETDGVFKVYTPVRVLERVVKTGEPVTLRVQNRFNFLNLSQTKIEWQSDDAKGTAMADIAPHATGDVTLPIRVGGPGWSAMVTVTDTRGVIVAREVVSVPMPVTNEVRPPLADATAAMADSLHAMRLTDPLSLVPIPMVLPLNNQGGVQSAGGTQLSNVIDPFTPMPTEVKIAPAPTTQPGEPGVLRYTVETADVSSTIEMTARSHHCWTVSYRLAAKRDVTPRQWGVVFTLPAAFDTLTFEHDTPFTWYPPEAIGRPSGTAKANPIRRAFVEEPRVEPTGEWRNDANALGTNDFRATRAHVRRAGLSSVDGRAVIVTSRDASQAVRTWIDGDVVHMMVAGFNTGGSDHFFAAHYRDERRPVKAGQILASTFEVRVTP